MFLLYRAHSSPTLLRLLSVYIHILLHPYRPYSHGLDTFREREEGLFSFESKILEGMYYSWEHRYTWLVSFLKYHSSIQFSSLQFTSITSFINNE